MYNTYQMYLRDAKDRIKVDVERAGRGGYAFGIKVVRGAYMSSERERAVEFGYEDPIHPTIEDTHSAYDGAVTFLAEKVAGLRADTTITTTGGPDIRPLSFVIASHNRRSVELGMECMERFGVPRGEGSVAFAQLMGMKDKMTFGLAKAGYKAYKVCFCCLLSLACLWNWLLISDLFHQQYIPYGPISVTIPYLQRRAQENAGMLSGGAVAEDKNGLVEELKKRLGINNGEDGVEGAKKG